MRYGETTSAALRIGPLLALDVNGDPVLGEDFGGAGEFESMENGADFGTPDGTIEEIGGGYYYYQATAPEALLPWLAIKITGVCQEFTFRENIERVPSGIKVGETDATKRRIGPLLALDASGDPVTGETFAGAGEAEITLNGSAWDDVAGSFVEDADGYYYYIADTATELTARGWGAIKIGGTACEEFTLRFDIIDDEVKPVITYVSPTPGVAPGAAGGFPADPSVAKNTPIVIQLSDANPGTGYVNVAIAYTDDEGIAIEETVYRRSNFRGRYLEGSKAEMVGSALQLTIKREGGWLELLAGASNQFAFHADVVDSAGNVSVED